jgi:hypothetical protein
VDIEGGFAGGRLDTGTPTPTDEPPVWFSIFDRPPGIEGAVVCG